MLTDYCGLGLLLALILVRYSFFFLQSFFRLLYIQALISIRRIFIVRIVLISCWHGMVLQQMPCLLHLDGSVSRDWDSQTETTQNGLARGDGCHNECRRCRRRYMVICPYLIRNVLDGDGA